MKTSKIEDYLNIKERYESYIEKLNWCMGKLPEGSEIRFDPEKSRIEFIPLKGQLNIELRAEYGYEEQTQPVSAVTSTVRNAFVEALNMYLPEIIPAAQKLLQAEIDKAREEAKDEVKEIMDELGCGDDCSCKSKEDAT